MSFTLKNLISLIQVAMQHHASDIHIRQDEPPALRLRGDIVPVQTKSFTQQDIIDICQIIFPRPELVSKIDQLLEFDGGYSIPDLCRIRYNFFHFNEKYGLIMRLVKNSIPTIETLGLPKILNQIAMHRRGLILVTGATGSGKSTTLAALINHINHNRAAHILTIEDPIEFVHPQIKSRVTQREVARDTESFNAGLRSALRQDPDIILIGEMRDAETVSIALKASETGHLVFSTVHTTNSVSTISRIISMFAPEEQDEIRKRLSESLYATIGQRMLKRLNNKGVAIAMEIMISNPGIKDCILGKESLSRIFKIIHEGHGPGGPGTQTFDQHVMELFKAGMISKETALEAAESQSDFMQKLMVN